jgi:hypothetical protein
MGTYSQTEAVVRVCLRVKQQEEKHESNNGDSSSRRRSSDSITALTASTEACKYSGKPLGLQVKLC